MKITRVKGADIGVLAYKKEGYEEHGLVFLADRDGDACGAQCANCSSILWTNSRRNSILNEEIPEDVPDSGSDYTAYFYENMERFLASLPECPECGKKHYDIFFTNIVYPRNLIFPRFEDGTPYPFESPNLTGKPFTKKTIIDPDTIQVWWYEEDAHKGP
jgi:hypothetical protein